MKAHVLALPLTAFALLDTTVGLAQEQYYVRHPTNSSTSPIFWQQRETPQCCLPYYWGDASADRGVVRATGSAAQLSSFQGAGTVFPGSYKVFDVIFGAPAGVNSTSVLVYATIQDANYSGSSPSHPISAWGVGHEVWVGLNGLQTGSAGQASYPPQGTFSTGLLAGYTMQGSFGIVAGPFIVPTNTPVILEIAGQVSPNAISGAHCTSRFGLWLGENAGDFGGPFDVFGLQPGITANAVSAGIVDNQWTPASEVGFRFCEPLAANSSGSVATITATGSGQIALNDTTLVISGLPLAGTTAMLINSTSAWANVNNPASGGVPSDGRICIGGGTFGRHWQHIYSGTAGTFSAPLDLTALPHPSPSGTYSLAAVAGETWYWQCWYRDQVLGAGRSNFSTALGIRFE